MRFAELVETHIAVAERSARLEKIERVASLLSRSEPAEAAIVASYLTGTLPQGRIGLGPGAIRNAHPAGSATDPTLTLAEVHETFTSIAAVSGKGSAAERARLLHELLSRASGDEQRFLSRLLVGDLRQGALDGVMVESIARASGASAPAVRRAVMHAGDVAEIARAALVEGPGALDRYGIRLFRPIRPMLAQSADTAEDALDDLDDAVLEYKLDGARIQVHKDGEEVRVYSRRLREVTAAVPEVVAAARALPLRTAVLDGEAIALRADGRPHPFQVTMRRFGRKLDVASLAERLPLTPFVFDVLHAEGDDLSDTPLRDRERILDGPLAALLVPRTVPAGASEGAAFFEAALAAGHEGIMAKSLDAPYEAGSRGRSWIKIKRTHTLDLVVLAAEWGHGRRQGSLSNLHLGARNEADDGFVMLGKTFKGMTDAVLAWQTGALLSLEIGREGHIVHVRPELVVEIAFNDVQDSPHYPGALALRFARLVRYRHDKTAGEADTIDAVRAIHRRALGPP